MWIEGDEPQRLPARRPQDRDRARRDRLGIDVHQDLVGEGPGMAVADAPILARSQDHAGELHGHDLSPAAISIASSDAVAPRIGAPSPAIALAANGCQAALMRADLYFMAQRAQALCLGGQFAFVFKLGWPVGVGDADR